MNAPADKKPVSHAARDPFLDLAERVFIGLASRVYSSTAEKKPDPKALAAFSFRLAEAFEAATKETTRAKAAADVATKAAVRLDEVDLSSVFESTKK
jgi:hypothetical protein